MGKTLAQLALTGFAALGIFGTPYVGAQPAAPVPAQLEAPKPPQEQKQPLPSDEDLKKAETDIREVYKTEYQIKDPAKRQEFANKLFDQALQIKNGSDLPTKCVLLREAYFMSSTPKGLETAFKAAGAINDSFQTIDLTEMKSKALETAQKGAKLQEDLEIIANNYAPVIEEALNQDKYDTAATMAKSLKTVATSLKNKDLVDKATKYEKDIPALKTEYITAAKALETISKTPTDGAANLVYGKFLAKKGEWDKAMEYFAKGSDTDLKDAATVELLVKTANNNDAETLLKAAEKWEAVGKKAKSIDQERFYARAVEWYQNALNATSNPVAQMKIKKKLTELEGKAVTQNGLVNLLALIDPQKDAVTGQWKIDSGPVLVSVPSFDAHIQIPYEPPEEYDLQVIAELKDSKPDPLVIGLVGDKQQFAILFDDTRGANNFLQYLDGKNGSKETGTYYPGHILKDNEKNTIDCYVRKTSLLVKVNNKIIFDWKTADYKHGSINPCWKTPNPNALFLGAHNLPYRFYKISVKPISGNGKILKH